MVGTGSARCARPQQSPCRNHRARLRVLAERPGPAAARAGSPVKGASRRAASKPLSLLAERPGQATPRAWLPVVEERGVEADDAALAIGAGSGNRFGGK